MIGWTFVGPTKKLFRGRRSDCPDVAPLKSHMYEAYVLGVSVKLCFHKIDLRIKIMYRLTDLTCLVISNNREF